MSNVDSLIEQMNQDAYMSGVHYSQLRTSIEQGFSAMELFQLVRDHRVASVTNHADLTSEYVCECGYPARSMAQHYAHVDGLCEALISSGSTYSL
jgi:hypothetical protein